MLYHVSDRLSRMELYRGHLVVIPYEEAKRGSAQVRTPQEARLKLGATHALHGSVKRVGEMLEITARLTNSKTGAMVQELSGAYTTKDPSQLSMALTGLVTNAL